jgi:hypothetical protein
VGNIDAIYNPSTKKLKGTFTNNGSTGHLEFSFEGNSFKGKWGWTTALTGGDWNGDKHVKNNKVITTTTTPSTSSSSTAATSTNSGSTKFTVSALKISTSNDNIYGFWGFKLFKVTASGREQVQNFGNKPSDVFNQTENGSKVIKSKSYTFPNSPEFFREFIIPNADLNNPNIKYELEVYIHAKNRRIGSNINFGMVKEIYRLDNIEFNKDITINLFVEGTTVFTTAAGYYTFKVTKTLL